jgi:hypothetical protein
MPKTYMSKTNYIATDAKTHTRRNYVSNINVKGQQRLLFTCRSYSHNNGRNGHPEKHDVVLQDRLVFAPSDCQLGFLSLETKKKRTVLVCTLKTRTE